MEEYIRQTKTGFIIDTTPLNTEQREEMAKLLFKCGYAVRLIKKKDGSRIKYFISCEGEKE